MSREHNIGVHGIFAWSWPRLLISYAHTVLNSSQGNFGPSGSSGLIFFIGLSHCHLISWFSSPNSYLDLVFIHFPIPGSLVS